MKSKSYTKNAPRAEKFHTVAAEPRSAKPTPPLILATDTDIRTGIKALRRRCEFIRLMHDFAGDPPLRRRAGGFDGLARIIIGQQVSVASANAIWARFDATITPLSAEAVLAHSDDDLRGAGLSRPKVKTLRAVSQAIVDGLDLNALAAIEEADAHAHLTAISGIGPWTADVYLMFCVGRADVFAPGDLALQVAAQMAMALPERPTADHLAMLAAERWRPWRGVAARMLWHYYAAAKAAKSGLPV